ncbi:MAG TPA: TatD family deoxyribonuclease [Candidatus Portnoybacteria bacterium]|nr:TatD family deoxyribonuclease [Candidatus Portnoybacteria bacterium]
MLIDTHAHLNFKAFKNDFSQVIRDSLKQETWLINVGSQLETSQKAVEIAEKYQTGVYAAVGLHPIHVDDEEFDSEKYQELAKSSKVVALGETGLDYKANSNKNHQKEVFRKHLELAEKLSRPVIVHCRQAHNDVLEILKSFLREGHSLKGVMHCFSGDWSQAQEYFKLGFLISFTGLITFARDWDQLIEKAPLEKLMIETDCPFMTPEPHRGKRNEPVYVKYVAEKIAEIKKLDFEKVVQQTTQTAKNLFNLK